VFACEVVGVMEVEHGAWGVALCSDVGHTKVRRGREFVVDIHNTILSLQNIVGSPSIYSHRPHASIAETPIGRAPKR
jgi:hypothetical protein